MKIKLTPDDLLDEDNYVITVVRPDGVELAILIPSESHPTVSLDDDCWKDGDPMNEPVGLYFGPPPDDHYN